MKKRWWQYLGYIGGACFLTAFSFSRYLPFELWVGAIILGVITTAIFFFMQQGQRPENSN